MSNFSCNFATSFRSDGDFCEFSGDQNHNPFLLHLPPQKLTRDHDALKNATWAGVGVVVPPRSYTIQLT